MEPWHDFFVAVAGASAALTGLIFVGVSLSLTRMLSIPRLADRASEALILLVAVLLVSCICLAPELPVRWLGSIVLIIGIVLWLVVIRLDILIYRATDKPYKSHYRLMIPFNQLAVIPYLIAGVIILSHGTEGVYWLLPSIIVSFMKSVLDAWVILVEIHR